MPRKPPEAYKYKPGVSGNPSGRPKLPQDVLDGRKMNQVELERVLNKFLYLDRSALKEILENPKTSMIELVVASILAQASKKGDHIRFDFILTRILGKPKQIFEHTGKDGKAIQTESTGPIVTVTLPSNGREAKEDEKK